MFKQVIYREFFLIPVAVAISVQVLKAFLYSMVKKKLDADFRRYIILGACNPPLAYQALQNELEIGLLLPCNVIVYETDEGRSTVSIVDPLSMMGVVESDSLQEIADQAKARLTRVAEALASS